MKYMILILISTISACIIISVNADADYEDEETELPLCTEHNEVYKDEISLKEDYIIPHRLIKKNTFLKCRCHRRDNNTEKLPRSYPVAMKPEQINITYFCPGFNETDLTVCGRHAVCQEDVYEDYGEEKPQEKYIDYSLISCNCSNGRSCQITNRNPNRTIYKCIENKYDEPLRPCTKDEDHMVINYAKEISGDVKLNTSIKCSCNNHGINENYTRIVEDPDNPKKFTAYHRCPEHFIPSKRIACRENVVSKKSYLVTYGREKPGEKVKITDEYCICGPPPRYHTLLKYADENSVNVNRATYRCKTRVCNKDEVCKTYVTTNYFKARTNETNCQCNGECNYADFFTTGNGKEGWFYETCNHAK